MELKLGLSHTHSDIARFLLENPTLPLGAVAAHFGYTQPWLSSIIHSGAFRAHMAELQGAADDVVVLDVPARLRGVASSALDKLGEQLAFAVGDGAASRVDRQFVRETADMALKALGYGRPANGAPTASQPSNVIYADRVVINEARQRILDRGRTYDAALPVPQLTDEQPLELQASS